MAKVKKVGGRFCVAHEITGQVLKRKGRRVCFNTRGAPSREAKATRCRVVGGADCPR